jgi:ATP/maltotriose-dependent transcriptional regulator MalT
VYPDLDALRDSVEALLERGDTAAARSAIHPVGHAIAIEDGPGFRDLVTGLPEDLWQGDPLITAALGSSYRAAGSPPGAAALAYFRSAEAAFTASADELPPIWLVSVKTGHAAALRAQGRLTDADAMLDEAAGLLEAELDHPAYITLSARISLEGGIVDLLLGRIDEARHRLEYAHGLAVHLCRAEQIECMGALALVAYAQGDLEATDRMIAEVEAADAPVSVMRSGFGSPYHAARILITTDRFQTDQLGRIVDDMAAASVHTEWEPFAGVVAAYARSLERKPIEALDLLHRASQGYLSFQPSSIGRDIGELLRADLLSVIDRGDESFEILAGLNPHQRHALCPERFMARIALHHGDLQGADQALADCELLGEAHSPRTLIDVQLLRSAIELERGNTRLSDVAFDRALHAMARTGVRSPFRHIPPALLARLVARAQGRTPGAEEARMLARVAEATDGSVEGPESLSERERLVLVYVERKLTVAQIAAELFISPNTVKTHLRRLYRKLGVATREEAIRKARSLGLHLDPPTEITRRSPAERGPLVE